MAGCVAQGGEDNKGSVQERKSRLNDGNQIVRSPVSVT